MGSLVVYDSAFGNTAKIAEAIADTINCKAIMVNELKPDTLNGVELLVIGTPTQGGMATKPIQEFMNSLDDKNMKVAVFDTRFDINGHNLALKLLMKTIGFAAPKMAKQLESRGFTVLDNPMGFIVTDKKGPLGDGELEKAMNWAKSL